jgi:hypothetical protein
MLQKQPLDKEQNKESSNFRHYSAVANAPVWLVVAARPLKLGEYKINYLLYNRILLLLLLLLL